MARPEWRLSESAKSDLLEIAIYTVEMWGEAQGDAYIEALYAHLDRLCDFPLQAPTARDIAGDDLRISRYRSHSIFFTVANNTLTILRILHTAQDPDAAFQPPPTP